MVDRRFAGLATAAGRAPSRRRFLGLLGGGGLLAGLGATVGRGPALARAASEPCVLDFVGTVRLGPSAGQILDGGTTPGELRGQLSFTLDDTGAVAKGAFALADGSTVPVVGQADGVAITLRLALHGKQVVVAVGAAAHDLATCQGAVDGLMTGPSHGDLGDWRGSLSGEAQTTTSGNAGAGATTGTNSSGNQTTPAPAATEATSSESTATSTTVPEPTATETPETVTLVCSDSLTDCNGVCNDLQNDVNNCGACGNVCAEGQPGYVAGCLAGNCFYERARACDAGLTSCSSVCVDTTSDAGNCGACGNACGDGQICFSGLCATDHRGCPNGQIQCGDGCFAGAVCP